MSITVEEKAKIIKEYATKIRALGDDIYGYNIPGACGGCQRRLPTGGLA